MKIRRFPSILACALIALLATGGTALAKDERGYLGVMLQDISSSIAKALQLDEDTGVLVSNVVEDSPADEAGLEDGDVILEFDGDGLRGAKDLTRAMKGTEPGDKVTLLVLREGKRKKIDVELGEGKGRTNYSWTHSREHGEAPRVEFFGEGGDHQVFVVPDGDEDVQWFGGDGMKKLHLKALEMHGTRGFMGVELGSLSEQLGEYFGVENGEGALIDGVREDSPAEEAGLRAGDVIVRVGDEDIEDAGDVRGALVGTEPGDEIEVEIVRKGDRRKMKVTLAEGPENDFVFGLKELIEPHGENHFEHRFDIRVPEGIHEDIHVIAPGDLHKKHRVVIREGAEGDLDELKDELKELKEQLKELKEDMKNK